MGTQGGPTQGGPTQGDLTQAVRTQSFEAALTRLTHGMRLPWVQRRRSHVPFAHASESQAGKLQKYMESAMRDGKAGKPLPLIVQKSDGGFNYATTDLAAIRYRLSSDGDGAERVIYVTDAGQASHFAGVFQVAQRAGWVPAGSNLEHVPFGLVQGEDGKKLKTRSGETVRLKDLLDEAVERSEADLRRRLGEEERSESDAFISEVATTVGLEWQPKAKVASVVVTLFLVAA